jgi:predicted regulator of Ras-like GTPase activity (Roadblock/LC7/MglB family)
MPAPEGLLLVTLTDHRVNVGLAHLEMQQALEELG